METIGIHCIAELYDCPRDLLDDESFIVGALREAVDEGLATLIEHNQRHPDGLLRGGDLNDPWGQPYEYVYPGLHGTYDLICYGADRAEGGSGADADLVSWEMK